jgi:LysR family transcriptional regulator, cell division regulator
MTTSAIRAECTRNQSDADEAVRQPTLALWQATTREARLDAGDLKIFAAVAQCGGMNRAAELLNTVQSNVTARIRALEEELGSPLFDRHSRGVSLTAAGKRLLPYADNILRMLNDARRAASEDGEPRGTLTVGSLETTAALRLAPVLSDFVAAFPAVDLVLRTGTTCDLTEEVLARRIEGAFVCGPVEHPELEAEVVFEEELAVLAAPQVRSLAAAVGGADVRIVVLKRGCSYRQRLEGILARRGIQGPRILEFGTLEAIVRCVGAGLGITLLPRRLLGRVWEKDAVSLHVLPKAEAIVQTLFIRRRDAFASSALLAFLQCARPRPERRTSPALAAERPEGPSRCA